MTRDEFAAYLETRFEAIRQLRAAGQREYSHNNSAFDNFERLARECQFEGVEREQILWVYLKKHLDGILSHLRGNRSQREPVQGRIQDAIVYLFLLMGMEDENSGQVVNAPGIKMPVTSGERAGTVPGCDYCKGSGKTRFNGTNGAGEPFTFLQDCPWCPTKAEKAEADEVAAKAAAEAEAEFARERGAL